MDQTQLDALEQALLTSPDNLPLLSLVLDACSDNGDVERATRIVSLAAKAGAAPNPQSMKSFGKLLLESGREEQLLELFASEAGAECLLLKARAMLALGRREEAANVYQSAVKANPTLEDERLSAELRGKVVPLAAARRQQAEPVVANDNTDTTEVVRLLKPETERVRFADIGGLDAIKNQIRRRIITPFQKPSLFERFRRKAGGGILMYGPPGCGKTLLARATAGECGAKFLNVAIDDILDMWIGESERKLHEIFEQARRSAPTVLFFDEIEALGGKRQYTREATSSKLVSQFLAELDGFAQNNQGMLILGATNVPWAIDPAFRRPGRFDRVLFVPPPDQHARKEILRGLLDNRPVAGKLDIDYLAERTSTFSGADLRHLVDTAVDAAIESSLSEEREVPVSMEHLKHALQDTKPTTLEWLTTARNYARYANEGGQYDNVLDFLKEHGRR